MLKLQKLLGLKKYLTHPESSLSIGPPICIIGWPCPIIGCPGPKGNPPGPKGEPPGPPLKGGPWWGPLPIGPMGPIGGIPGKPNQFIDNLTKRNQFNNNQENRFTRYRNAKPILAYKIGFSGKNTN